MVWVLVALPHKIKKQPCQRYHKSATIENRMGFQRNLHSSEGRPRWRLPRTHRCFHACHPPETTQFPRSKAKKQKCWSGISEGSRSTPQLMLHTRKKIRFLWPKQPVDAVSTFNQRADCKLRSTKFNHLQHYPRGMITPTWGNQQGRNWLTALREKESMLQDQRGLPVKPWNGGNPGHPRQEARGIHQCVMTV